MKLCVFFVSSLLFLLLCLTNQAFAAVPCSFTGAPPPCPQGRPNEMNVNLAWLYDYVLPPLFLRLGLLLYYKVRIRLSKTTRV